MSAPAAFVLGDPEAIPDPPSIEIRAGGVDITGEVLADLARLLPELPRRPRREADHPALVRVRKVGAVLHAAGGLRLMQAVFYRLFHDHPALRGERATALEIAWDGVGEWQR